MAPRLCTEQVSRHAAQSHRPVEAGQFSPPAVAETEANLLEAVLQAWSICRPLGQVAFLDQVTTNLQNISACIPGAKASLQIRVHLRDFFRVDGQGDQRTFLQRLSAEGDEVQFLYFWRSFSEVARLLDSLQKNPETPTASDCTTESVPQDSARLPADSPNCSDDSLAAQLESFRDKALGLLRARVSKRECGRDIKEWGRDMNGCAPLKKQKVALSALRELLRKATTRSNTPQFWEACGTTLLEHDGCTEIDLQQLTSMMLKWLDSAITRAWDTGSFPPCAYVPAVISLGSAASKSVARQNTWEANLRELQDSAQATGGKLSPPSPCMPGRAQAQSDDTQGILVFLNIYDAFHDKSIQWLNSVLAPESAEYRFGGAFHTGVEVNGMEWSYGYCPSGDSGVAWNHPRDHHQHQFRQCIPLGYTQLSPDLIMDVLTDMCEEYPGPDYHMLRRNCCHFADDFSQRLAVGGIPGWLHRLARIFGNAEGLVLGFTRGFSTCSCSNPNQDLENDSAKAQWLYRL